MRIYIDVTKLLEVSYVTGIQRVVREVVLRLLQKEGDSIVLMNYNEGYRLYKKVNNEKFIKYFKDNLNKLFEREQHLFGDIKAQNVPENFWINYLSATFVETVRWWALGGMKESAETIAEYFFTIVRKP